MSNVVMLRGGSTSSQRLHIRRRTVDMHAGRWSLAAIAAVFSLPEDAVKKPEEWIEVFDVAEKVLRKTFGKRLLQRGNEECRAAEGKRLR
jgi:hypothetical protein